MKSRTHLGELKAIEVSTQVFANLVGLSTRRIQQLRELGLPFNGRGRIHLVAGYEWLLRYQKPETESLQEAKLRKLSAEANLREIELKETEGHLINRQEIIEAIQKSLLQLRIRLLSIPTKLSPVLAVEANAALTKNILEDEIHKALSELSLMQFQPQTKKQR